MPTQPTTAQLTADLQAAVQDPVYGPAISQFFGQRGHTPAHPDQASSGLLGRLLGDWGFWDRHPTLARAIQIGVIAAPAAFVVAPAIASAAGGSGGGAGAAGAETTAATAPTLTGTSAGLSGAGATTAGTTAATDVAAGGAGAAGAGAGPMIGGTPVADFTGPLAASGGGGGGGSALSGVGKFLTNPLGSTLLSGGFNLLGAGLAAHGQTEAAKIQAESFRQALAYEKQRDDYLKQLEASRYSDVSGRLQPYIATGQSASDRMAQILGLNPAEHGYTPGTNTNTPVTSVPAPNPLPQPIRSPLDQFRTDVRTTQQQNPGQFPLAGLSGGSSGLVNVRAPTGETRMLPQDQARLAVQRGAQIVG